MESVTLVSEPLLNRHFVQFEILVPILEKLSNKYDITLAAPRIAPEVQEELERRNIRPADGGARFPPIRRPRDEIPSYVVSWARDALWGLNRRDIERVLRGTNGLRINISMTTAIDADVWLIQSRPLGLGLDAMRREVNLPLRVALGAANPFVGRLDLHHVIDAGSRVRERYSSTRHVGDWFGEQGLPVKKVLPMYYRPTIHRTTTHPSRDYIFVYVGKETDSTALRMLLDTGLPITMFGSKSVGWVVKSLHLERYPQARLLGYVTDEELSDYYSNARFVAFPFTEEPFGLVPLEAMACGTPVLTYGQQGPGETVLDGRTGWLVPSREEFVRRAVELWNDGAPSSLMVERCLEQARTYHLDTIRSGWDHLIESAFEGFGEEVPKLRVPAWTRPTPALQVAKVVPAPPSLAGSGRGFPGVGPMLERDGPTVVPLGEFPPLFVRSPTASARSGAYLGSRDPERNSDVVVVDSTEIDDLYGLRTKSSTAFDGLRPQSGTRRTTEEDPSASPL